MNLLNFFNTLDVAGINCGGGVRRPPIDCRGANTAAEFDRVSGRSRRRDLRHERRRRRPHGDRERRPAPTTADPTSSTGSTRRTAPARRRSSTPASIGNDAIKVGSSLQAGRGHAGRARVNSVACVDPRYRRPRTARARPGVPRQRHRRELHGVANHLKSKGSGCNAAATPTRRRPGQLQRPAQAPRSCSPTGWRPTRPAPATPTCSSSATSTPTPRRPDRPRSRRPTPRPSPTSSRSSTAR